MMGMAAGVLMRKVLVRAVGTRLVAVDIERSIATRRFHTGTALRSMRNRADTE